MRIVSPLLQGPILLRMILVAVTLSLHKCGPYITNVQWEIEAKKKMPSIIDTCPFPIPPLPSAETT